MKRTSNVLEQEQGKKTMKAEPRGSKATMLLRRQLRSICRGACSDVNHNRDQVVIDQIVVRDRPAVDELLAVV